MRIMIASDIHGSAYYCEKMIEAYHKEEADKLILLGDLLYHGPRNDLPKEYEPKRVIGMLNQLKDEILCVRGNCEAEVDQMVLEFPVMAEYCILYTEHGMLFIAHGHNFNMENIPPMKAGDILVNGHTHIPMCMKFGKDERKEFLYINPGSVSIPKENSTQGYIIMEDDKFLWKDFKGNVFMELCMVKKL